MDFFWKNSFSKEVDSIYIVSITWLCYYIPLTSMLEGLVIFKGKPVLRI